MKAVVHDRYGYPDVLRLAEVEKPVPADDEILVKVHAVSVNRSDWEGLTGEPLYARIGGLFNPRYPILGSDVAGRVEAVGRNHADFREGDEVFGEMENYRGGFAEYACTRAKTWARKPPGMSFETSAAIPQAAVIALQGLRGNVQAGQRVLINGAGGGSLATFFQILLMGPLLGATRHRRLRVLAVRRNRADLEHVMQLCEAGKLDVPIDKTYPLEAVPEALRDLGEGRAKGKLVIGVVPD